MVSYIALNEPEGGGREGGKPWRNEGRGRKLRASTHQTKEGTPVRRPTTERS